MGHTPRHSLVVSALIGNLALLGTLSIGGCGGDSLRRVEETDEYSFDEMAAEAVRETELSETESEE